MSAAPGGHRRTVRVLVTSQVLGGVGVAGGIAVGGLLAEEVSGSTSLSGLPQTATVLGAALLAVPMARLAVRSGRRVSLAAGYAAALAGAVLSVAAAVTDAFWLLLIGGLLFGGGTAANLQARYAATDDAPPARRARALSIVVWATTIGAVAGPNLIGLGGRLGRAIGVPALAGPYLFSVLAFVVAGCVVFSMLARRPAAPTTDAGLPASGPTSRLSTVETLRIVVTEPRARLGLVAIATAHAVMVGVMAMTPVHMGHGGASLQVVGIVISAHIAGMYAASPVFGWLTDRAGRLPAIGLGLGLLLASLLLGAFGAAGDHARLGVALTLLGLGWSCCLVAGSTLVSESVPETVRTSVQGSSDLVMGIAGASAGALAGPVLGLAGYPALTLGASVLLVPVVVLALLLLRSRYPLERSPV